MSTAAGRQSDTSGLVASRSLMAVYLIRHAQAGPRTDGPHDMYRQLTEDGHAQASRLVELLEGAVVAEVLTSPATRCAQTVAPLAENRQLDINEQPDLWEGSRIDHVLSLLEAHAAHGAIACSHGDIIPAVIETIAHQGATISGRGCEKASIWVLEHDGTSWLSANHVPAP